MILYNRATIISQLIRPILLHMYENVDASFLCRVNTCRANWANGQVLFDFWLSNVIQDTLNSAGLLWATFKCNFYKFHWLNLWIRWFNRLLKWANNWFKLTPNQMIEWMNPMIELESNHWNKFLNWWYQMILFKAINPCKRDTLFQHIYVRVYFSTLQGFYN